MYEQTELIPSGAETANGEGEEKKIYTDGQALGPANPGAKAYLDISASGGTSPTLDVTITKTIGGIDFVIGTFAQKTGTGQEVIDIPNCPQEVKAKFTIGGSAGQTFTFQVHISR